MFCLTIYRSLTQCYLCGKTGHVRRECPGIADDGRGESKYTKSNGDTGSVHLKKGRKKHHNSNGSNGRDGLRLPPGFENCTDANQNQETSSSSSFLYYDAGFGDGQGVLEYLRFGRHGHGGKKSSQNHNTHNAHNHTQIPRKDAISEYDTAMKDVCETTNFGGCIVRSYMPLSTASKTTNEPWTPQNSFPFSWCEERKELLKFVIGYRQEGNNDDDTDDYEESVDSHEIVNRLVEIANHHKGKIVGLFADLDYACVTDENEDSKNSRAFQMERLRNTLKAASRLDCPIQIRIEPGYKPCQQSPMPSSIQGESESPSMTVPCDGYSQAIKDLGQILLESSVDSWKVHLSSWNGKAEHLVALSGAFSSSNKEGNPQHKLVFGFDGSLGFSKAVHLHESAFEVCPENIVLETGGPGILPPVVAKRCGRNAFCHAGHIPFVAEELAKYLSKNPRNTIALGENNGGEITAETVARLASNTTKDLYRLP